MSNPEKAGYFQPSKESKEVIMNQKLLFKVYGLKRSKGVMRDTGKEYDSTTLYVGVPFDESSGNMRGLTIEAMKYGKSDNYAKFDGIPLPFDAEIELQTVSNGRTMSQQIVNVVPLKAGSAPVK